jgi:hypothetical protein
MAMDVYLIPVGADRYELYCEHVVDEASLNAEAPAGTGRFAAVLHKFKAAVARVEQEQQSGIPPAADEGGGWRDRLKRRMLCWIAEKVAEQRLLWRIRKESDVALFHPDDVTGERALATSRTMMQREADRHLKWTIIDGVLFCASGIVMLLPGPNPLAYYFGFRFIGHFLSRRGATHALNVVRWECRPSAALTLLRGAVPLDAPERARQVHEVASALHLQHLPTFFERTAIPAA